ncbi:hypothetical protein DXG01_001729, partial [Tephrocybe rancida]
LSVIKAWYFPPPRAAFVPMALPLPPSVQEILEIIVPTPTQTFTPEPIRTQPVLNIASSPTTAPQDLIGPLQFAAIVATSYCFGKPAEGNLTRKRWGLLSCVLLTVGIISGAKYASSRFGLDLADLDPLAYTHTTFLTITRTGTFSFLLSSLDVGLLLGPLKHGFNVMFPAAAQGAQRGPNPITSTRFTPADIERIIDSLKRSAETSQWDPSTPTLTPADIEHFFGPLRRTAFPAAANGVQFVIIFSIRDTLLEIKAMFSRSLISVDLGLLFGPLRCGLCTAFPATARNVLTSILTMIASTLHLSVIFRYLLNPFEYYFNIASTAMVGGVQWIQEPLGPYKEVLKLILPSVTNYDGNPGAATANVSSQEGIPTTNSAGDNRVSTSDNAASNDASTSGPVTTTQSAPTRLIPALVRRALELIRAACRYINFIYKAPHMRLELEDRLIHEEFLKLTAKRSGMVEYWLYLEETRQAKRLQRKLDRAGTALSEHAEEIVYVGLRCSDLEERNAYLEDEARDAVVESEVPPPDYMLILGFVRLCWCANAYF